MTIHEYCPECKLLLLEFHPQIPAAFQEDMNTHMTIHEYCPECKLLETTIAEGPECKLLETTIAEGPPTNTASVSRR